MVTLCCDCGSCGDGETDSDWNGGGEEYGVVTVLVMMSKEVEVMMVVKRDIYNVVTVVLKYRWC